MSDITFQGGIGNIPSRHYLDVFTKLGYCLVKSAVSAEIRDFITQYALFDEMQNFHAEKDYMGEAQVPEAHSKYADPAMEVMLLKLQNIIEENTGLKLFPTYSYYRVYRPGDILAPHKDRPACEISATVCFNFSYDDPEYKWPIYMENTKISMEPGDAVIYRGCDLSHWRDEFVSSENSWHVQGFFHFVDANGPYADQKFDGRPSIGEPECFRQGYKTPTASVEASKSTASASNKKSYIQYTN